MTNDRFVNNTLSELQEANRSPIFGYENSPILTLEEAVEKIIPLVSRVMDYVATAKQQCNRRSDLLTRDESAAVYLYSMPTPFFSRLNDTLRVENRHALKPWFAFLKLFITALEKLESTRKTVWRGVAGDVGSIFADGDVHIWWSVNSCSMDLKIVQPFLGDKGTLFAIDAIHGKDITMFSANQEEQEIILMPGTRVRALSPPLNFESSFFIVHLEEENPQGESQSASSHLFEQIRQIYEQNSRIQRIMNPEKSFPIEQSYINLAIVNAEEQQEKEKQLRGAQHSDDIMGNFEEIYGTKTAIDVKDIFETCKNQEKQVLVFGRAGIGKSTFCRYIAYQWATGSYWSQYRILALIPLRRLTANRYPSLPPGQSYSLVDLVKKEVFQSDLSEKDDRLLKKQFDAKKTLWILDGYDEIIQNVPPHLQCLFEQLLKTPHHIATSRPYLNTLSYDVKMEITGFTDKNIVEYVQQFFNQMKDELDDASIKSQTLLNFLKSKPNIWGVAHIPVNLELICSLWSNQDWLETKELTITELYTMLTEWLCRRYLTSQNIHIQNLSADDVYQYCQKELSFLESLAFNAMESNTIILRPPSLRKALNEAQLSLREHPHILNIGVLKAFNKQGTGTQIETEKDHYFVHLSFQEYFAARYLINALKGSLTEKAIEFIKHQKYNQRYALVFTFASGLLNNGAPKSCLNIFWETIQTEPLDLVGIRHMQLVISCIEETLDKSIVPRSTELLEWIAKCIQYNFSRESNMIHLHLVQALQRAQSVVCHDTIINVLIDLLRYDATNTKTEVLWFISQLNVSNPPTRLMTSLITTLDDKNDEVRVYGCGALGYIGEKAATNEVISRLVSALEDENEHVRWKACIALAKIGEIAATNQVISKLVSALEDENEHVRSEAWEALGRIGGKAATNDEISQLVSALEHKNAHVRGSACWALGNIDEKVATNEVISKLVSALCDQNTRVRSNACCALGKIGEKAATNEVISKLLSALGDENAGVRRNACEALEKIGEKAATNEMISKLVSALGDQNTRVRSSACYALGRIGEKAATNEVISKLLSALGDENEHVRWKACIALAKISEKGATNEVISKLVSALGDQNRRVRSSACYALGKIGEKAATNEVISKLLSALGDENADVRRHACEALGKIGEKGATNEVISKLLSALGDENGEVRRHACEALGKIGEKGATNELISKLLSALGDENGEVRRHACYALGKIGEKGATNEVISKLLSALGDENADVRGSACEALEKIGEKGATNEVISKLVSALGDENADVIGSACQALGMIGEKAATNEVIGKLAVLLNSDNVVVSGHVANVIGHILSSSAVTTRLSPEIVSKLCLSYYGLRCLKNASADQLIKFFFTAENASWLPVITRFTLLVGAAVTVTGEKVVVYGRKESVELSVPALKLREQLVEAFTDQAKRLQLWLELLWEARYKF